MEDSTFADSLSEELASTPIEVALSLRLLKAFLRIPPEQRPEIIEWMEQRATEQALRPNGEHLLS
jgi:hypothetical protein